MYIYIYISSLLIYFANFESELWITVGYTWCLFTEFVNLVNTGEDEWEIEKVWKRIEEEREDEWT